VTAGHVGYGEVYLVEDGDDLEVVLHRQVQVRERLGLDALARVDDEEAPSQAAIARETS
jgi:hypothetical protein